jgi:hypothetical protein
VNSEHCTFRIKDLSKSVGVVVFILIPILDRTSIMKRGISHCNDGEGFTPVRRRLSTIDTRQTHNESQKEWTAARCNRLLRALKSRVAILDKDLLRIQDQSQSRERTAEVKAGRIRKAGLDTDWTQARKRVKRTYSTRGGRNNNDARVDQHIQKLQTSSEARPFIPGEVSVPTPLLNRARGDMAFTGSSVVPPLEPDTLDFRSNKRLKVKDVQLDSQLSRTLRDIRKETPAIRYSIYEGIYNGLEALLKATTPEEPEQKRAGPKSLLSLCLRAVPYYIAQEEEAYMEEIKHKSVINSRDIPTEVYDDLEAFGSHGKGWKSFRIIVRSHGIQLVSNAIRTGSLEAEFVGILITLCIHAKATKEAEVLLSSFLSTSRFPAPKSVFTRFDDDPATRPLSMLWKYVEITGSFSFQYRQLSALICDDLLPMGWLATKELAPVWTRVIQALSTGPADTDALLFMDTVLPLLARTGSSGRDEDRNAKGGELMLQAVKQTFLSLLTTLSSIVILSGDAAEQTQAQNSDAQAVEYGHFVTLMRSCLMQWELSHAFNTQGTLLVMTNLLLRDFGHERFESKNTLVDILANYLRHLGLSSSTLSSYQEVVTFICSIARCCGRGASNSGFEHLKYLHQTFENLVCDRDSEGSNIVREIIADSALGFAQDVPDRKHLDYAETMEAKVHRMDTKPQVGSTPGNSLDSSLIGFRWEEGISEWVTATPFMSINKCRNLTKLSWANQSECETPFRPAIQRKVNKSAHVRALLSSDPIGNTTLSDQPLQSSPVGESSSLEFDDGSEHDIANDASPENEPDSDDDSQVDLASQGAVEFESPDGFNTTGDALAPVANVHDLSEEEKSDNELQPSSPQSESSGDPELASPASRGSSLDESFTSVSSANSSRSHKPGSGRRHIDRGPRLSRRILQQNLQWQLFDEESDDELSFISVSSEGGSVLHDVTDNVGPRTRLQRQTKSAPKRKSLRNFSGTLLGDSEDELCI